jgi:hypothetical protein
MSLKEKRSQLVTKNILSKLGSPAAQHLDMRSNIRQCCVGTDFPHHKWDRLSLFERLKCPQLLEGE